MVGAVLGVRFKVLAFRGVWGRALRTARDKDLQRGSFFGENQEDPQLYSAPNI